MADETAAFARDAVARVYQSDSRRVLATLIRLLGDFDLAEEALHDAVRRGARAVAAWRACPPIRGAWLVSTGRFKAIDAIRRRARFDASLRELARAARGRGAARAAEPSDDRSKTIACG